MNRILLTFRLSLLAFTEWLFPEPITRCPQTEDGKHIYDPYVRANGFDGCIWCGRKREKGWME